MSDEIPPTPPAVPPTPPEPPEESLPKAKGWKDFFQSPTIPYPTGTPAEKQWATGMHASGFAGFVIPFGNLLAPFVIWMIKRPESAYLDEVGKEVINFHLSFLIYAIATGTVAALLVCLVIPVVLPIAVVIGGIVYMIQAIMRTTEGRDYRYPATIRFIK